MTGEGIRRLADAVGRATDEARWFKVIAPNYQAVTGFTAVLGYRGYELCMTVNLPLRPNGEGAVFKCGVAGSDAYRFDFDPTPEGIAEACQRIDVIIAADIAS